MATGVQVNFVVTYGTKLASLKKGRGFVYFFMYFSAVGGKKFKQQLEQCKFATVQFFFC